MRAFCPFITADNSIRDLGVAFVPDLVHTGRRECANQHRGHSRSSSYLAHAAHIRRVRLSNLWSLDRRFFVFPVYSVPRNSQHLHRSTDLKQRKTLRPEHQQNLKNWLNAGGPRQQRSLQ